MRTVALLVAPYLSVLLICRSRPVAGRVARHTAVTLPLGWIAVLGLLGAVVAVWSPPLAALAAFAALSGLAMITSGGRGGWDDHEPEDDDLRPEPDWDAFDNARRRWARDLRGPREGARVLGG